MSYYSWYYPGSDETNVGVTAVFSDEALATFGNLMDAQRNGEAEDVFDVSVYDGEDGPASRQALENVLQLANIGLKVLLELPRELDEAVAYHDEYDQPYDEVEGGWLDHDGSIKSWEAGEDWAASQARIDALSGLAKKILVVE